MKTLTRLPLFQIQERLKEIKKEQTLTFHLQKGLILYVRSEHRDPEPNDFEAWIPNPNGKGNLWTYAGEIQGLMALIAEYRRYTPPSRRKNPRTAFSKEALSST